MFNDWNNRVNCTVRMSIVALLTLLKSQCLRQLIEQGDLELEGDLQLIQQLMILLNMSEFNVAALLAPWLGDVALRKALAVLYCVSCQLFFNNFVSAKNN